MLFAANSRLTFLSFFENIIIIIVKITRRAPRSEKIKFTEAAEFKTLITFTNTVLYNLY